MLVIVRISKTVQEKQYEPYMCDISVETETNNMTSSIESLVEKVEKAVEESVSKHIRSRHG